MAKLVIGIYARQSTTGQDSIDDQLYAARREIERLGLVGEIREYTDIYTGNRLTRKGLSAMLKDKKRLTHIVVRNTDRLTPPPQRQRLSTYGAEKHRYNQL